MQDVFLHLTRHAPEGEQWAADVLRPGIVGLSKLPKPKPEN